MKQKINSQWQQLLNQEKEKKYFIDLLKEIDKQRAEFTIYPKHGDVFNAFHYTDLSDVRVIILGQDPYHGANQAHGLAFSVNPGIKIPPSLVNIFKELTHDITGFQAPKHGYLARWAEQGVLLLNTVLTVQQGNAHSHANLGWEVFTDEVIQQLNTHNTGCVFMLWGAHAQRKGRNINTDKHLVLAGPHPSPLSAYRGFFGCQHFSQANAWLKRKGLPEIDWTLPIESEQSNTQ
jgi:uracil-DNA glycosylase